MQHLPFEPPTFKPGWVWLVGAGPGDPGLLTLNALHALSHADAIIFDALVDKRILELARVGAECIFAGKRGGKPSPSQPDIFARLIELAKAGKRVLRLKGGDPFLFGRGGEEALALTMAGVPFRVVPGITAGTGGLAYAGIPATHRTINSAVTFLTAHDAEGGDLNWAAIAQGAPVIVAYMGLKHLDRMAARLIAHGRAAEEPTAIIASATTPRQRVVETTLGEAAAAAKAEAIEPPTLVVVGEVVRLRTDLDWLGAIEGRDLAPDPIGHKHRRKAV